MAQTNAMRSQSSLSEKEQANIEVLEHAQTSEAHTYLQKFNLLAGKSTEELDTLNKKVLSKLDWRFLPCITAMLLMK